VFSGSADAGMGIHASAKMLGLDFIPLATERFDLIIPSEMVGTGPVKALRGVLDSTGSGPPSAEWSATTPVTWERSCTKAFSPHSHRFCREAAQTGMDTRRATGEFRRRTRQCVEESDRAQRGSHAWNRRRSRKLVRNAG